jgi:hypothetical protein
VPGTKRRSPTWQLALLLLIFGVVVGYPSFEHLNMWGGKTPDIFDGWDGLGAFVALMLFVSGCVSLLWIAVKAVAASRRRLSASCGSDIPQSPNKLPPRY